MCISPSNVSIAHLEVLALVYAHGNGALKSSFTLGVGTGLPHAGEGGYSIAGDPDVEEKCKCVTLNANPTNESELRGAATAVDSNDDLALLLIQLTFALVLVPHDPCAGHLLRLRVVVSPPTRRERAAGVGVAVAVAPAPRIALLCIRIRVRAHLNAVLFVDASKCNDNIMGYLHSLGIERRDYVKLWQFLRKREWGVGKILITPQTSFAISLMLTHF
ncbi:hypothetical protein B0H14DRAFT_3788102 [Mycena olivaceomarginata]|nr:hypothetical protein B0H14DRAFT_3788102 [Mycena olivaceomarginata]